MQKYTDYSSTFIDTENNIFSGLAYVPDLSVYQQYFKEHIVTDAQEYRQDKIAYELWGSQDAGWVLDVINDFTNGVSEYWSGRAIKYLDYNTLITLGLL